MLASRICAFLLFAYFSAVHMLLVVPLLICYDCNQFT